ncbi:hypothetical protein D3C86_2146130 [compost metagenome]
MSMQGRPLIGRLEPTQLSVLKLVDTTASSRMTSEVYSPSDRLYWAKTSHFQVLENRLRSPRSPATPRI